MKLERFVNRVQRWNKQRVRKYNEEQKKRFMERRKFLAVMCIVKNEELNIDEWIQHYLWQGADHLFIIDNGSTDDTYKKAQAWAQSHSVTVISRPQRHNQTKHYQAVFREYKIRKEFHWLLIADADEFWCTPSGKPIPESIADLAHFDLVYCNWTIFGASKDGNHPGSLRKELLYRRPLRERHSNSKWVAKTDALRTGRGIGIHRVKGIDSSKTVTEHQTLKIHHYISQSLEFWKTVKMTRGSASAPIRDAARSMEMFERLNEQCTVLDRTLADQLEAKDID